MTIEQQVAIAAQHIQQGRLVAFPTETVYGLGANALNPMAVAKIFEAKRRPSFDPLIVHIASIDSIHSLTQDLDERVFRLAKKFWPGPLTLVLPKSDLVPSIVSAGLQTVGIRMPSHRVALDLIEKAGCPIAAPSANLFGRLSPTCASHVRKQLPDIDFIIDGESPSVGIESTIVSLNSKGAEVLRHGVITQEEIESVVPLYKPPKEERKDVVAPGLLKSHYSPSKPLFMLGEALPSAFRRHNAGLLTFSGTDTEGFRIVERLTEAMDLKEAAVNLFAAMHRMDESDVEYVVAEPIPRQGIGIAIMDRLTKAAYRYRVV